MNKLIGIVTTFSLFVGLTASSPGLVKKEVEFEVRIGSRVLGDFKVTKQQLGDRKDFVVEQIIEDGLLHKSKVHYWVHSQYVNNRLQTMEMRNTVDDVLLQSSDLELRDDVYHLATDLGSIQLPATEMVAGSVFMFFQEPEDWTAVFHEKYGQMLPLEKTSDHIYEVALPNGGREVYTYNDGRLTMFMIEKTFGMFSMTLKEPLAKG